MADEIIKACVFCGEFLPMTKEHIWGKWIRAYLPDVPKKHTLRDVEIVKAGAGGQERISIIRRSHNAIQTFRKIVCDDCNNQFLSRLQNGAKPYVIPLLEGERTVIGEKAQSAIAAWATMVTMTAEFMLDSGSKIGVPQSARAVLRATEKPLDGWKVWIANYPSGGVWSHQWSHTSVPIIGGEQLPNADNIYTPLPNTQTTTFVVGKLYVHTMSGKYSDLVRDWHWLFNSRLRNLLVQVWPIRHQFLAWPVHGINDADVQLSSEMFIRHVDYLAKRTGF